MMSADDAEEKWVLSSEIPFDDLKGHVVNRRRVPTPIGAVSH
jgi:hypothetical protein